jgi:hypothetical protein
MKVAKKKATFFNCSAEKRSYTLVSPFAYHRYALKLLPPLGTIELLYTWQLCASIFRSTVVSPAKIKARSWAEHQHAYH